MLRPVVTSLCGFAVAIVLGLLLHAANTHAQESLPATVARHEQEIQELRKRLDELESTLGPATGPEAKADRSIAKATQASGECFQRAMEATGQYQLEIGQLWKPKDFLPLIKITRFGSQSVTLFSDNSDIHGKTLGIDQAIDIVHQTCPYTLRLVKLLDEFEQETPLPPHYIVFSLE